MKSSHTRSHGCPNRNSGLNSGWETRLRRTAVNSVSPNVRPASSAKPRRPNRAVLLPSSRRRSGPGVASRLPRGRGSHQPDAQEDETPSQRAPRTETRGWSYGSKPRRQSRPPRTKRHGHRWSCRPWSRTSSPLPAEAIHIQTSLLAITGTRRATRATTSDGRQQLSSATADGRDAGRRLDLTVLTALEARSC
jgi:hypothetical protein